jgi:hypothetical protein
VLDKTWGARLAPPGQTKAIGQFWPNAIKGSKALNPDFCYVAECYWDREYELQVMSSPQNIPPAVERTWHMQDSQGQIMALWPWLVKFLKPFKLFPLRGIHESVVDPYRADFELHPWIPGP